MPKEPVLSATRPPFPTYLLPSFSFSSPFTALQRRSSSAISVSSIFSANSLSSATSSIASAVTTPSTSLQQSCYRQRSHIGQNLSNTARLEWLGDKQLEEGARALRLGRIQADTLKCSSCATDLAFASQIVSKGFTGRHGRAYLISASLAPQISKNCLAGRSTKLEKDNLKDLVNTKVGRPVSRQLVTGAHVVADISCAVCSSVVGWKYVDAKEPAQRYKIGKFILETRKVVGEKSWEVMDITANPLDRDLCGMAKEGEFDLKCTREEEVEFDSEDEDECEELFAGTWDAEVIRRRRERRFQPMTKASDTKLGVSF